MGLGRIVPGGPGSARDPAEEGHSGERPQKRQKKKLCPRCASDLGRCPHGAPPHGTPPHRYRVLLPRPDHAWAVTAPRWNRPVYMPATPRLPPPPPACSAPPAVCVNMPMAGGTWRTVEVAQSMLLPPPGILDLLPFHAPAPPRRPSPVESVGSSSSVHAMESAGEWEPELDLDLKL